MNMYKCHESCFVNDICHHIWWCSKKPVREDFCTYLTPATHLLALRREKAEVEQALVKQKEVGIFHSCSSYSRLVLQ